MELSRRSFLKRGLVFGGGAVGAHKIPEQAAAVRMVLPALAAESVLLPTVLHLELLPEQMLLILSLHLCPLLYLLQVLAVGDDSGDFHAQRVRDFLARVSLHEQA